MKTTEMTMHMTNQTMDMNSIMYPADQGKALNYGMLRSPEKTTLPEAPTRELHFNLTGNMNRYVWTIDNKAVSETDEILIKHGENIRIILHNGTMMRHPMHLHGHFFRLLNGQGDYAPLKEVVDILPMETDTLEFAATESGDWFFHCHILYHMMSGMGRIFHYEGSPRNRGLPDSATALRHIYSDDRAIRPMARVGLESNGSDGEAMLADTRYRFQTEWRLGTDARKGYESESHLGRYLGQMQYWLPYVGWDFRYRRTGEKETNLFGQTDTKDHRNVLCAGVQYTLPLLLVADWRIDTKGNLRLQLGREDVAVTSRLRFSFMVNTDKEYMAGLRYIITKYFGLSTHYDSDMGFGAGVTLNY
jgi:Multicopper oxidase